MTLGRMFAALSIAAWAATAAASPLADSSVKAPSAPYTSPWQDMARYDLDAMADWIDHQSIEAVYPDPDAFARRLRDRVETARKSLPSVNSFAGYRGLLQDFVASFQDAHLALIMPPVKMEWPGFLARYQGGRYVVAGSTRDDVKDGAAIGSCDGRPIKSLISDVALHEVGLPEDLLEARAQASLALFADRGNLLLKRPSTCVIDGKAHTLTWKKADPVAITRLVRTYWSVTDHDLSVRDIPGGGAWVRIGTFHPQGHEQATLFHDLIKAASALRQKPFIVLDVRGNTGGSPNWFVGFLHALYGEAYTDHYATARLSIRAVNRVTPQILAYRDDHAIVDREILDLPDDKAQGEDELPAMHRALKYGKPYIVSEPPPRATRSTPPPNPVAARVYVLTDQACASACVMFVDELKYFPGVAQIGTETGVDRRTGNPLATELPSGLATLYVPTSALDNRERGDNVPQRPERSFDGDIADTHAVEAWFLRDVMPTKK